jgi:hypothetical protein
MKGFSALPGGNPIGYTFMKVGWAHDRLFNLLTCDGWFGQIGHVDEISRRTRRRAGHITRCLLIDGNRPRRTPTSGLYAKSLGCLKRLIYSFRDPLHVGLHGVAERSHGGEWLALKQRPAQFALQGADGVGQRGLRDPAALGGTGEVALLAQGQEVADLVHLHV